VGAAKNFSNVKAISNSYGGADFRASGLGAINNYEIASRMGIAVTASSGDSAYGVSAPASFSNVIGVGGTTLNLNSNCPAKSSIKLSSSGFKGYRLNTPKLTQVKGKS
jgi:subtilase family serine protease